MTETPDETIARLQREIDDAKIAKLQRELNELKGPPPAARVPLSDPSTVDRIKASPGTDAGEYLTRLVPGWVTVDHSAQPLDTRLAPAPRAVPRKFRLILLPWSWWTVFTLFMVAISPIAVWIFFPIAGAITVGATFLVIVGMRARRYRLQMALLKWGGVATVVKANVLSRGTYFSGTTYQNVRLAQAQGWRVQRRWYRARPRRRRSSTSWTGLAAT